MTAGMVLTALMALMVLVWGWVVMVMGMGMSWSARGIAGTKCDNREE